MKTSEKMRNLGLWFAVDDVKQTVISDTADEVAQLEAALTLIGDLAYDRDGHTGNAEKLGELVDEIHGYARSPQSAVDALKGED